MYADIIVKMEHMSDHIIVLHLDGDNTHLYRIIIIASFPSRKNLSKDLSTRKIKSRVSDKLITLQISHQAG